MSKLKPCLVYLNERPHYELTGEELIFRMNQEQPFIYAHMRPYAAKAMKSAASGLKAKKRWEDRDTVVFEDSSLSGLQSVFDKSFIELTNVGKPNGEPLSIDEQKVWLERNPAFKERVVNEGLTGIVVLTPAKEEGTAVATLDIEREGGEARQIYRLYDVEKSANAAVVVIHEFAQASESDRQLKRSAEKQKLNQKKGENYTELDCDAYERLYDKLVNAAQGFLIDGEACVEENKDAWVSRIPFWHKKLAIDVYFNQVEGKND